MNAPLLTPYALPAIDTYWPGEGGLFSGVFLDTDRSLRALILAEPAPDKRGNWTRGIEWSRSLDIDGHRDFLLPDCREGRLLWANLAHRFSPEWYWLREEISASLAWYQYFTYGHQLTSDKSASARWRACRSFILQPFGTSGAAPEVA